MANLKKVTFVEFIPMQAKPTVCITGQKLELLNMDQVRRIARDVDAALDDVGGKTSPIYKIEYQNGDKAYLIWNDSGDPLSEFSAGKPVV